MNSNELSKTISGQSVLKGKSNSPKTSRVTLLAIIGLIVIALVVVGVMAFIWLQNKVADSVISHFKSAEVNVAKLELDGGFKPDEIVVLPNGQVLLADSENNGILWDEAENKASSSEKINTVGSAPQGCVYGQQGVYCPQLGNYDQDGKSIEIEPASAGSAAYDCLAMTSESARYSQILQMNSSKMFPSQWTAEKQIQPFR